MQKKRTLFPKGIEEKKNIENLSNEKRSNLSHPSDLGQHTKCYPTCSLFCFAENTPYTVSSFYHKLITLDINPLQE